MTAVLAGIGIACGVWVAGWGLVTWVLAAPAAENWTDERTWRLR